MHAYWVSIAIIISVIISWKLYTLYKRSTYINLFYFEIEITLIFHKYDSLNKDIFEDSKNICMSKF